MQRWVIVAVGGMAISQADLASAQFGRLIKEGAELVGKKVAGKTAREVAEEGTEQLLKKVVTEAGQETTEAIAKRAGITAARYTDDVAEAMARHGGAVTAPLVNTFGDDGAKALTKLSSDNARRMAMLSEDFAAHGRGSDWMKLLTERGDTAADWIWKNKETLAVATTATAFLANPDPFLQAGEAVMVQSIQTAGEHVAKPLLESTTERLVPMAIDHATGTMGSSAKLVRGPSRFWPLLFGSGLLLGMLYGSYRWYSRVWQRLTR